MKKYDLVKLNADQWSVVEFYTNNEQLARTIATGSMKEMLEKKETMERVEASKRIFG